MHRSAKIHGLLQPFLGWALLLTPTLCWADNPAAGNAGFTNAMVLSVANRVEVLRFGSQVWDPAYVQPTNQVLHPGDRLRTGPNSRTLLRLSNLTDFPVGELTLLEIPREEKKRTTLRLLKGIIYFFHRDKPGEFQVDTPTVSAVVRGTEFNLKVDENGTSTFSVFEGELEMSNEFGRLDVRSGEEAVAVAGKPPIRTAVIITSPTDTVQWCLYYPGILNLEELLLSAEEQRLLTNSLAAYRSGDLLAALANYPAGREPASNEEKIYRAALLLTVGNVTDAEIMINALPRGDEARDATTFGLGRAIQTAIAAVQFQAEDTTSRYVTDTNLATIWLAESYAQQSQSHLEAARAAARRAVDIAPDFAFAWTQLAELEFGFGRTRQALAALENSLRLAPLNAQAQALKGFLLAAQGQTSEAIEWFDKAIAIDGALGNAWLGRGLCLIRSGNSKAGRANLQTAAALEPNRSILRSYLGKAWSETGNNPLAIKEFDLAKQLDPLDPTPWFYSALLNRDLDRINPAVKDLEQSEVLNENRSVFRSRLLLDQDYAMRSSALANIYRSAGMNDVAVREASQATTYDYANYSAHLFLANSLDSLRDPTRFNLRYETAWFNELLLANMLAPVSAGIFAQSISQQEYFQLFDVKKIGLTTTTDYRSDGQYREVVSQFGNFDKFSYSLDLDYQHNDGVRPNNELDRLEWYSQMKFQITPSDTLFLLTKYQDYHSGDNFQYYNWHGNVRTNFTYDEYQKPIIVAGFHHEWSPGVHTLLLGGRLVNDQREHDQAVPGLLITTISNQISSAGGVPFGLDVNYHSEFVGYTAELNQIFQGERQTLVLGGRFQTGQFETSNELSVDDNLTNLFLSPAAMTNSTDNFQRETIYAYYTLEPINRLFLTAGVSYDQIEFPTNLRHPPVSSGEDKQDLIGPKAALVYTPAEWITFRGAYTRSLGGVTLDQSYRLEPTQLAGFIQSFRSVIPESVVGSVSAPEFETFGGAVDLKFKSGTYVGINAGQLTSTVDQHVGVFGLDAANPYPILPSATSQDLKFTEQSVGITLNQLLGEAWSCGASYRFTSSKLNTHFTEIPTSIMPGADDTARSDLHHLGAYVLFNHPSGFFTGAGADWYWQDNTLETHDANSNPVNVNLPGDQFPQFNLFAGWRFPRQRGDVTIGVLNIGGEDYHLNPLNSYAELPHERVFTARLRLRF